jgi:3-phosphoshikimate 1-carboxyvinyltransferase
MVAPQLPEGLTITLEGQLTSRPYLELTIALMEKFGASVTWESFNNDINENVINIANGKYKPKSHDVESDWSSASYWFGLVALSLDPLAKVFLSRLTEQSKQGDRILVQLMRNFGVESTFVGTGLQLSKISGWVASANELEIDCTPFPDLAQTLAVVAPLVGQTIVLRGLHTLRIKETDRIVALQAELPKIGIEMEDLGDGKFRVSGQLKTSLVKPYIRTYSDHRMAMSLAMVGILRPIELEAPEVVNKSYPNFWQNLQKMGLGLRFL